MSDIGGVDVALREKSISGAIAKVLAKLGKDKNTSSDRRD
jgi:hypothetical protein